MDSQHNDGFMGEIREFHLEIKDRLARIETKQDNVSTCYDRLQSELTHLYAITNEHGKEIASINGEIRNFKWIAGVVAGIVTGLIQFLVYALKGGK